MLYPTSHLYQRLLEAIEVLPVIDCHEHMQGPEERPRHSEPVAALISHYYVSDLYSAAFGVPEKEFSRLSDPGVPTDEKWPLFQRLWQASEHTAYARMTKEVLHRFFHIEGPLTRAALDQVSAQLAAEPDPDAYERVFDQANIRAAVVDVLGMGWLPGGLGSFLSGEKVFPARFRPVISLPELHPDNMTIETINIVSGLVDRWITSLDEFTAAVFELFERCLELGCIGMKDQSAYTRTIAYGLPSKSEAEHIFNSVLNEPLSSPGTAASRPLNDWLFHQYMRFARDHALPVQVHTGHMAGVRNRLEKTNAAHLTSLLELHRDVRFDLFHGNWPYMGDLLYLGKNYPNVTLNLCWLHIIDPLYAIELMERAVLTMPHSKIHGFGGDFAGYPEFSTAHLQIARRNIAAALANLVEGGWLDENQALCLAADWLFNNPNRFFNLGLAPS